MVDHDSEPRPEVAGGLPPEAVPSSTRLETEGSAARGEDAGASGPKGGGAGRRGAPWTALLVAASVAFGVVLASGLGWTPPGAAKDPERAAGPVRVPPVPGAPAAGFADLAEAVAPAVVSIRTVSYEPGDAEGRAHPLLDFFTPDRRGGEGEGGDDERELRAESGGSGFLVSPDGLVVTNDHVIQGAAQVLVRLDDRRELAARVRGSDPETDIALLEIEKPGGELPYLQIGDSDALRVGDWVMVIGNPLQLGRTVTVGVVSATGRALGLTNPSFENFIQTDAAINFGNSGGPVVDVAGAVVGIATAINWGAENIGFAVPASSLRQVLPELEREGRVRRGYLGVNIENLDFAAREAYELEDDGGVLVLSVVPGSPAAVAGLEHGDVLLEVAGQAVGDTRQLIDQVAARRPGSELPVVVLRDGARLERRIELGERPSMVAEAAPREAPASSGIEWLGLSYQELTPALKASHGIPEEVDGVWVRGITARSPLADEGVEPGDVIVEVNGTPVAGLRALEEAVERLGSGDYVRLYVQRFDPRSGDGVSFFAFTRKP